MGLMDAKGYDSAFIEDPVHCGEVYITSEIFNSGADMPPGVLYFSLYKVICQ